MIHRKIIKAQAFVHQSVAKAIDAGRARASFRFIHDSFSLAATKSAKRSRFSRSPWVLFAREIFDNPRAMGAACPSSRQLAQAIAQSVPLTTNGLVVELGAGTGNVTAALLTRGLDPEQLVVIERSATLAEFLRRRFPTLRVIEGDAMYLSDLLGKDQRQVSTLVSGLPLLSLPPLVVHNIINQMDSILQEDSALVQFTYNLSGRSTYLPSHFKRVASKIVWGNLPPARVDVYHPERVCELETELHQHYL